MFVQDRENPAYAIDSVIITRSSQIGVSRQLNPLLRSARADRAAT
jgi:hypothetical protein